MNDCFEIESGGFELLQKVEELWYELKREHALIDACFPDMSTPTFDLRQKGLREAGKVVLVDVVTEKKSGTQVGYCFSSVDGHNVAEIESLFIVKEFRREGMGRELVKRAVDWMEGKGAIAKRLSVRSGNREAIEFYKGLGFRPRVVEMMIPTDQRHSVAVDQLADQ